MSIKDYFRRFIEFIRNIAMIVMGLFYCLLGIINIIVLVNAIAIKFHVGLLLALIISIPIGYFPVVGSALTVWGGCVWLGLNLLQSAFFFLGLPIIIAVIFGSLLKDE